MPSEARWPADWWVPDWPAPAGVKAVFTSRQGGQSLPPFDSFNLGDHVRDEPARVAANRAMLAQRLGARPVFLQQVHGVDVAALDAHTPDGTVADACWTDRPGVACTVMVADCLPVLFCDLEGAVVAAAHAGWRGLLGHSGEGVIEHTWRAMADRLGARADVSQVLVWLGPCIGPQAFEVGPEVRDAFVASHPEHVSAFVPAQGDRWLADLPGLARQRLQRMGVRAVYGNDGTAPWCTVTQGSRFFSHRRDAAVLGSTGRMAGCVWLDR
jgi:YfiH family protein